MTGASTSPRHVPSLAAIRRAATQPDCAGINRLLAERAEALALEGPLAPADFPAHEQLLQAVVHGASQDHAAQDLAALVGGERRADRLAREKPVARIHDLRARLLEPLDGRSCRAWFRRFRPARSAACRAVWPAHAAPAGAGRRVRRHRVPASVRAARRRGPRAPSSARADDARRQRLRNGYRVRSTARHPRSVTCRLIFSQPRPGGRPLGRRAHAGTARQRDPAWLVVAPRTVGYLIPSCSR